jgi:methylenetetrahydrofolate dehydrogenase (NADP+) / methenyltetrahydrofolate cyclohydrolase
MGLRVYSACMTASSINGKLLAESSKQRVAIAASAVKQSRGYPPGIAVVRVGNDPASKVYVDSKEKTAKALGMYSVQHHLPDTVTTQDILTLVSALNADKRIDGILVQLPLPKHIDTLAVLDSIAPNKDVDGFHPYNAGLLFQGRPHLVPCTPWGVMHMLESIGVQLAGKRAVVLGRSTIVGRPMGALLLAKDATVVYCHSKSDVQTELMQADIVIAAIGKAEFVRGEWLKPGCIVIDVGINRKDDGKLVGDVHAPSVQAVAAYLSPVPGGAGTMTIAMLVEDTVKAAQQQS